MASNDIKIDESEKSPIEIACDKLRNDFKTEINGLKDNLQQTINQKAISNELQTCITSIEFRIEKLKETINDSSTKLLKSISEKAYISTLEEKTSELKGEISNLNRRISDITNASKTGASSDEMKDAQGKHGFNTCIFLCAILVFNILAIWFIAYRPNFSAILDTADLTWHYILPLIAIMLVNIVCTVIWMYHFSSFSVEYDVWEILIEIGFLIFNVVVMWLFAFHPLEEVTGIVIALLVFLMLGNITLLVARILYFANEHISLNFNTNNVALAINIICTIVLLIIFIFLILVLGIRV